MKELTVDLDGKVALVTGGGRGIGRSIALAFARSGATVVVSSRTEEEINEVAENINQNYSGTSLAIPVDVTVRDTIEDAVNQIINKYGRIDVLVNNAGTTDKKHRPMEDLPEEVWNRVIDVNLKGTFNCTQIALPYLYERGKGNIINITSLLGQPGEARPGESAYSTSKFGIEGLSKVLAKEASSKGLNVNTLFPAAKIDTGFFDHLDPEKQAELTSPEIMNEPAKFLAAQEPGGLTGRSVNAKKWRDNEVYKRKLLEAAEM